MRISDWSADVCSSDLLLLRGLWDGESEARFVGEEIEALVARDKNHDLKQVAILVRTGAQTREFEERFITLGLPYRVVGGPRFYERLEIRDALSSEEHTSVLPSLIRIQYTVFCLTKK